MSKTNLSDKPQPITGNSKQTPLPKTAWQKPQLQQLRVSLDTAFSAGSNTDGLGGSSSSPN